MNCPDCGERLYVLETRHLKQSNETRRRYGCKNCEKAFASKETLYAVGEHKKPEPVVRKKPEPVVRQIPEPVKKVRVLSPEEVRWRLQHPGQKYNRGN